MPASGNAGFPGRAAAMKNISIEEVFRRAAIITLAVFVLYGILITFFPLLPFWIDEWLLMDNLKFKTAARLWGPLEHTQQFPRAYLWLIKLFTRACDYSYISLRLPSFLTHCCGLALLWHLSGRIFSRSSTGRFLWLMVYVSYNTSIHYFAQLKQYTMDMALSLVAIWQLLAILRAEKLSARGFALLMLSFALAPFFSYTYPIVAAPAFVLAGLCALRARCFPARQWMPLCLGAVAIGAAYLADTRQVLADPGMQDFWRELLMKSFSAKQFFSNAYAMFCNLGSGDLFGNVFGIAGVAGFIYGSIACVKTRFAIAHIREALRLYSCVLIWLVLALFIAGKLPLGTWRLNAFAVPAIAFMIADMLRRIRHSRPWRALAIGLSILLFAGVVGNVYATMAELAGAGHAKKLAIYRASCKAVRLARQQRLPVLVTSGIAYPFDDRWPGDWILKTLPCYKVWDAVPVFPLPAADSVMPVMQWHNIRAAVVLDGSSLRVVRR